MEELVMNIRELNCPNFWIPTINLFEDLREMAISEEDGIMKLERLVKIVRKIQKSGQAAVIDQWVECSRFLMENCCFYDCCSYYGNDFYIQDADNINGAQNEQLSHPTILNKKRANYEEKYRLNEDKELAKISSDRRPTFSLEKRRFCCGANCHDWRHEFDHY